MLFKCLLMLTILGCSALVSQVDDDQTLRIRSFQYGYVHHYGIYGNLDLLEFSTTLTPAHFRFTSNNFLQEISTGKCVATLTSTNLQLVLSNCDGPYVDKWVYDSTRELLVDVTHNMCFSPWGNTLPPYDIKILTGLSPCDGWNQVVLEYDSNEEVQVEEE